MLVREVLEDRKFQKEQGVGGSGTMPRTPMGAAPDTAANVILIL